MEKHILRIQPNELLTEKYNDLLQKTDIHTEIFFNETCLTSEDYDLIEEYLNEDDILKSTTWNTSNLNNFDECLTINDLLHLNKKLESLRKNGNKLYLHELLKGSAIVLPEIKKPDRNPDLEKRCSRLKLQQDNYLYKKMTKNVDNNRRRHEPEESIGYQIKEMNKAMILAFQFILSVVCAFAFGFLGISVFVGEMDIGVRILLGILCTVILGLAELYFIAKQINSSY